MADKTNALRLLDQHKVTYKTYTYEVADGFIDGVAVAHKIGKPADAVFKTLLTKGGSGTLFVFVIPVDLTLDLKKAAKAAGEKYIEMIPVKDITPTTGYVKGGCSPLGMKKSFATFIDAHAMEKETIIVSAGKVGLQMELSPTVFGRLLRVQFVDLT